MSTAPGHPADDDQQGAASPGPGDLHAMRGPAALAGMQALVSALNHLLSQHPNGRQRLAAHQGALVRVGVDAAAPPSPGLLLPQLWLRIDEQGLLQPAAPGEADVQLLIKPSVQAGVALLTEGAAGLSPHLRVEGSVLLAGLISELIQDLRWDFEDDLSRVIGDIPARRVGQAIATGQAMFGDIARRMGQQFAAQANSNNASPLASRSGFNAVRDTIDELNDRLDALERKFK